MAQKPSIPKGTRDFGPAEMARRNYIFDTIRSVYALYGFQQIETPAMENLSTLMGKYGEEGDKLLFKILNSGDFLRGIDLGDTAEGGSPKLAAQLCEKGLRYDLTVPFARYVVQHREELTMPFRRYQMQPVWRADRPQKGRYREFYQFDGDIVGSDSLLNEVELMQIIDEVFRRFGIRVRIKINNRKILTGIAEMIGQADKIVDITVAIDKLDKIGLDNVNAELAEAGIPAEAIERLQPIIKLCGTNEEKLATMRAFFGANRSTSPLPVKEGVENLSGNSPYSETGLKGCDEVEFVLSTLRSVVGGLSADVELDLTLARGLNYYTGCIFEVKALDVEMGSIAGGGRYDNLTDRKSLCPACRGRSAPRRHPNGDLPRCRQDEEADAVRQRPCHPLRSPRRRHGDGGRHLHAQEHGHRRADYRDNRPAHRRRAALTSKAHASAAVASAPLHIFSPQKTVKPSPLQATV